MNRNDIPGYADAVEKENQLRDAAFIDPLTVICPGVVIRQMAPEDFIILDGLDSVILAVGFPHPTQLARDLFILSPWYRLKNPWRFYRRWKFARACRQFDFLRDEKCLPTYLAVRERMARYFEATFQDRPASSGGTSAPPFAGFAAHYVNRIASTYGWPEEKILRTPFRRLYQYLTCIRVDNDREYTPINPSDKIRNAHNTLRNQRVTLVNLLRRRAARN